MSNLRPFQLFLEKMNYFPREGKKSCLNGRTSLKVDLDYVNDFMNVYKKNGFFGFMFIADYSHSNSNYLNQIDLDMYEFLRKFHENLCLVFVHILSPSILIEILWECPSRI